MSRVVSRIRTRRARTEWRKVGFAALPLVVFVLALAYAVIFPHSSVAGWLVALANASPFAVR